MLGEGPEIDTHCPGCLSWNCQLELDKTHSHILNMLSSSIWRTKGFCFLGSELIHEIFTSACFANILSIFQKLTFPGMTLHD